MRTRIMGLDATLGPTLTGLAIAAFALAGCATNATSGSADDSTSDLVGGSADARFAASGYLVKGDSADALDLSKPVCGATLIAPAVVVTAAHCVTDAGSTFAFGTGNVGSSAPIRVTERHAHPQFHAEAQGSFDITHALRNYDVAYLVLEHAVAGVTPAALPAAETSMGARVRAFGYQGGTRMSTPASVMFSITLGEDPIFEVHPSGDSALCVSDGDDGSAVFQNDSATQQPVLVGIFVGSVTTGLTDCVRGSQYLDGYESAFGYQAFLKSAR